MARDWDEGDRDEPRRVANRRPRDEEPDDYDDLPANRPRRQPRRGAGVATIIPYRNGAALAAYYCGAFGLIPVLGFILGPIAFILGIIGLLKARRSPEAHGTGHAIAGIVLGAIDPVLWIVLWFVVFRDMMK